MNETEPLYYCMVHKTKPLTKKEITDHLFTFHYCMIQKMEYVVQEKNVDKQKIKEELMEYLNMYSNLSDMAIDKIEKKIDQLMKE
jgi:hypothetical protein